MINFGQIKKSAYKAALNEEKTDNISKFFAKISKSKALVYEFYIYNNIKKTHMSDRNDAKSFLKENISFLEQVSLEDREKGINKVKSFLNENTSIDTLDSKIHNLIEIKLKGVNPKNITMFNESFEYVVDFIMNNEKVNNVISENTIFDHDEFKTLGFNTILKQVGKTFDKKYGSELNENDNKMIKDLMSFDQSKEINVFNTFKDKVINEIKGSTELSQELITESVDRISEMKYDQDNFIDDIIMLNDLIS